MQVWFSNRRAKNRRSDSTSKHKAKRLNKTSNGCLASSTGEDSEQTNSSESPLSNGTTSGTNSLPDNKAFVNNISSLNQTESTLNHDNLNTTAANTNNSLTLGSNTAGALTNDFNRANNSTLISLARINSGFNSFYPGLHSDTYG